MVAADLRAYLKAPYTRVLVPDETGGYVAEVLEFPGCFSQGETADEAMATLDDAMLAWLSALAETGKPVPEPLGIRGFSGRMVLRLPKWLHRQAAQRAAAEGVSMNQWLVDAIAERVGAEGFAQRLAGQLAVEVRTQRAPEPTPLSVDASKLSAASPESSRGRRRSPAARRTATARIAD